MPFHINAVTVKKLKLILIISLIGSLVGIIGIIVTIGQTPTRLIRGAIGGFLITALISATEIFYFSEKFKGINVIKILVLRSVFYLFIISSIILVIAFISESFLYNRGILSIIGKEYFLNFLENIFLPVSVFSIFASFLINFILQLSMLIGWRTIINAMAGRYKKSVSATRVFMFLDIKSSVKLGEKFGEEKYSSFLKDFFDDLSKPVVESGGEIYQYVGDEVVITWKSEDNEDNTRCLECFFNIQDKIEERKDHYFKNYKLTPDFKAGIHLGSVIEAEVGDLKKEIVFHGDVLNTASRIEFECNRLNKNLLVSIDFLNSVKMNGEFKVESIGKVKLRGKNLNPELFAVEKK